VRTRSLVLAGLLLASPAFGHGAEPHVWSRWTLDAWVILPLALSAGLYTTGVRRLWRRAGTGTGVRTWQVVAFALGWVALVLALVSPVHWLGERLFSVHMIEHEIVMAVAAPLLALARPVGAFLWALPQPWRQALGAAAHTPAVAAAWRGLTDPLSATILHGAVIWAWHLPGVFELTLTSATVHRLQHVSFLATALLFWWALLRRPRREYGVAALCVFGTMIHTGLLGALIVLAPRLLFPIQTGHAVEWGFTPAEDQQLAGLVMWVPAGVIYAMIALALVGVWVRSSSGAPLRASHHAA
jgi:putative membrane protein